MKIPTTVLAGEHDQLAPRYLAEQLAAAYPGTRLQILPGAHSGFVEFPTPYNAALLEALGTAVTPAPA